MAVTVWAGTNPRRNSLAFPIDKRLETPCIMARLAHTIPIEARPSFA